MPSPLWFVSLALCLSSAAALAQTLPRQLPLDARQQAALGVQTVALQPAPTGQMLANATVTVPPGKEVVVTAPYPGQLSRLLVGLGDSVKAGGALGQFTSPQAGELRRQWREAGLELNNARAAVERDQALLAEGIIPAVRLQLSRSKQEVAQALLQSREAELQASGLRFDAADTSAAAYATGTLKSPLTGVVTEALGAVGQRVEAGSVLFRVADTRQLQLDIQLAPDKAARLKVGDMVSIALRQAQARIVGISRAVDASQSARARALVTTRGSLEVGEVLSVNLLPANPPGAGKAQVWQLPARAISQWQGRSVVFVASDKGFTAHGVTLLSSNDDVAVMQADLPDASKVAVSGVAALRALLQKDE
jgi:cobalt-zinc-cadmium efflux system membrane fusion protein